MISVEIERAHNKPISVVLNNSYVCCLYHFIFLMSVVVGTEYKELLGTRLYPSFLLLLYRLVVHFDFLFFDLLNGFRLLRLGKSLTELTKFKWIIIKDKELAAILCQINQTLVKEVFFFLTHHLGLLFEGRQSKDKVIF